MLHAEGLTEPIGSDPMKSDENRWRRPTKNDNTSKRSTRRSVHLIEDCTETNEDRMKRLHYKKKNQRRHHTEAARWQRPRSIWSDEIPWRTSVHMIRRTESPPINRREEKDRDSTFQAFKQFEQEPMTDTRTDDWYDDSRCKCFRYYNDDLSTTTLQAYHLLNIRQNFPLLPQLNFPLLPQLFNRSPYKQ